MSGDVSELLNDVQARLGRGDVAGAEDVARRATQLFPKVSEAHNALGVVLRTNGDFDGAAQSYSKAVAADRGNGRAHANLGEALVQSGHVAEALKPFEQAVALSPKLAQGWRGLGDALVRLARSDDAARVLYRGREACGDDPGLVYDIAALEHDRGNLAAALVAYERYLKLKPGNTTAQINYASALLDDGKFTRALKLFGDIRAREPDNLAAQHGYHETLNRLVPPWHVPMMNEDARNFAYRDAIRAVVKPTDNVLEIGTGAGLLALLSAEAGARSVTTCEMVEIVAAEAKQIVARNGYADRITVVPKKSTDVIVGEDLAQQADVLVSEILANDFVGEGVLPSLLDAKARLLKPGARVIPEAGAMMGVLVGGPAIRTLLELDDVCGFDMRSFARFKPWSQSVPLMIDYDALSADTPIVSYDFNDVDTLKPANGSVEVAVTAAGRCYGVLQWIRVDLAPGIVYENHPKTTQSVWNKVLYAFPEAIDVAPGDKVRLKMWHSDSHFYLTGEKSVA